MKKILKGQVEIAFICIIIGLMLVMQYKSVTQLGGSVSTTRAQELAGQLNQLKKQKENLTSKVSALEKEINQYEDQVAQDNKMVENLRTNTREARMIAGLSDVKGPGITITLDYTPLEGEEGFDPFLVYPEYLLLLLNELNSSGAEAVSINDQRIISTSEIRLAGNHIVINGEKFSRPFVFKAIGDSQTLQSAIQLRGGIVELLNSNYIQVNIKREEEMNIPRYNGVIELDYAKPVEDQ
ncbi:DUF881 domain-containing protein [Irregularibacter muris]|uniref:DUF881 domain-containing protein n=1 Tax=Irregularibacter muris TaxID=1796619 RepID=A0AAE3L3C5_9FIRM|nr:DUF881 domain-containing protein [Irregularibacter muris]MCR1898023.1 DUF881 domain-containing protein [Irregularibacter muris]